MFVLDLSSAIEALAQVSDDDLRREISRYNLRISDTKFTLAFSAYGLVAKIEELPLEVLAPGPDFPLEQVSEVRSGAVFLFRAYTALVYMRSEHLEHGLDNLPEDSPLRPFRDFFRSGCRDKQEDTIGQHLRNALAHSDVELEPPSTVIFRDRNWEGRVTLKQLYRLCDEVYRFYAAAFEATRLGQ